MIQVQPTSSKLIHARDADHRWNAFVSQHPKGSIFHTQEMQNVFANTPNCEPFAIAMQNARGDILALLSAVRVTTIPGMLSAFATRSIWYAEPLCNQSTEGIDALAQLVQKHDRYMKGSTLFTEIRTLLAAGVERSVLEANGYEYLDYMNYVVDTNTTEEELWLRMKKSCRRKITRDRRHGVEIKIENSHAALERIYGLIRQSYRRSNVPLVDCMVFHQAMDQLPAGTVQARIAYVNGKAAAGIVGLVYGDRFFSWYGGTNRVRAANPFACLVWDELCWCVRQGIRYYDFGGAGWPDEDYGPRAFKSRFGGELVRFGRYRKVRGKLAFNAARTFYELTRKLLPVG